MVCLTALAACGDNASEDVKPDAFVLSDASVDGPVDAAPDSTPDASACWMYRYPQCGDEIYEICVPYSGCATWMCDGETFGYCGPG